MITVNYVNENNETTQLTAISPVEIVERLDVELDSGTARYLTKGEELLPALSAIEVAVDDNATYDFVGIDSNAVVRKAVGGSPTICKNRLSLVEPSKLAQGVLIDGFAVSQPEEVSQRQSLYEAVTRLLDTTPFDGERFTLDMTDFELIAVLEDTVAPEFKFNTQTTLWECLSKMGQVIDAVPRIVKGNQVTFDFINAYKAEYESISDALCNAEGTSVDESQYNTSLGAVVENVIEEI